ncbi:MAG: PAS domain S-box protein [Thermodesulfovibrionales bacterium]
MKVRRSIKAIYDLHQRIGAGYCIGLFGIFVIAVAWGSVMHLAAHEIAAQTNDIYNVDGGLAKALDEHVRRIQKSADDILEHMKMEYEDEGGINKHLAGYVHKAKAGSTYNQIAIANSEGDLILSAVPLKKPVNIAHRQHFIAQKAAPDAGLVIAKPVITQVSGTWSIFLSRRLNRKDGSFAGVVSVGLDPLQFSNFYSVPELGWDRSIIVVGLDRIVRARYFQNNSYIGEDLSASPVFSSVRKSPVGRYEVVGVIDGLTRFVSYRKMNDYPLIVMVSSLKSSALAAVEKREKRYYAYASAFTLFTLVFCLLLMRAQRQAHNHETLLIEELKERKRAEELLRQSERNLLLKDRINEIFLTVEGDEVYDKLLKYILEFLESEYGLFGYLDESGKFVSPTLTREVFWEECGVAGKDEIFNKGFLCDFWKRALEDRTTLIFNEGPFKVPQGHLPIYNTMVAPVFLGKYFICITQIANKASGYGEADRALLDSISDQIAPVLYARIQRDKQEKERRRVEDALRYSEGRYRELFGATTDALLVYEFDMDGLPGPLSEVNDVACRMLGYTREELLTMTHFDIVATEADIDNVAIARRMAEGETLTFEQTYISKDGQRIPVESTVRIFDLQRKPAVLVMVRDISGRKKKEQAIANYQKLLQRFMYESTLLEERERKRIADELHDAVGQNLVFSKLRLSSLRDTLTAAGEVETLEEIIGMLDSTIEFSRFLTHELANPVLYLVGLEAAVRWLAEQLDKTQNIKVAVNTVGDLADIQMEMRVLLYKTVRELLFNVVKHSQADYVNINIRKISDRLEIDVMDDGIGVGPMPTTGYGLISVTERISYLGGTIEIGLNTDAGRGTRVSIVIPLPRNQDGGTSA